MGPFRSCTQMGGKEAPLPKICDRYPAMLKLCTVILNLKKIQKIYESHGTFPEFRSHQHFSTKNTDVVYTLIHNL